MGAPSSRVHCLIVEDQALIGLALECCLYEAAGWRSHLVFTAKEALAELTIFRPDVAILDLVLTDGPCFEVATRLAQLDIPFLIYSGHQRRPDLPAEILNARWIDKPAENALMLLALAELVLQPRNQRETSCAA